MNITKNPFENFVVSDYGHKGIIEKNGDVKRKVSHQFWGELNHTILPISFKGMLEIQDEVKQITEQQDIFVCTAMLFTNLIQGLWDTLLEENDEYGFDEECQEWYIIKSDDEIVYESDYEKEETNDLL